MKKRMLSACTFASETAIEGARVEPRDSGDTKNSDAKNVRRPHIGEVNKHKFVGLDVVRGVAAISVVLMHADYEMHLGWLMPNAGLAVDLFFVMSGFVVAYSYETRIPSLGVFGFMQLRLARFFPLLVLGVFLGLINIVLLLTKGSQIFDGFDVLLAALAQLFFLFPIGSPINDHPCPLNPPAWSLNLEVWINLLYAMFLPYLTSRVIICIIPIAAAAIYAFACGWADMTSSLSLLAACSARILYCFPIGILIYRQAKKIPDLRINNWLVIVITIVAFMLPVGCNGLYLTLVSPLMVVSMLNLNFNQAFAAYMANASYFIYITHWPLIVIAGALAHRSSVSPILVVPFVIAILLVMSPLVDRYFDRPIRRILSQRDEFPREIHFSHYCESLASLAGHDGEPPSRLKGG